MIHVFLQFFKNQNRYQILLPSIAMNTKKHRDLYHQLKQETKLLPEWPSTNHSESFLAWSFPPAGPIDGARIHPTTTYTTGVITFPHHFPHPLYHLLPVLFILSYHKICASYFGGMMREQGVDCLILIMTLPIRHNVVSRIGTASFGVWNFFQLL